MATKKAGRKPKNPARAKEIREEVSDVRADAQKKLDGMTTEEMRQEAARIARETELLKEKVTYEDEGAGKAAIPAADRFEKAQRDYIPGTRRRDLLALPEYAFDEVSGERRKAFGPEGSREFHYCWVEGSDITRFKIMGYRMVPYAGGRGGLPSPGLSGTGLYECDISNHIKLGDAYLMFCEQRLYEALEREDRDAADRLNRLGETNFHNLGYRHGIKTFSEIDQVRQSN